MSPEEFKKLIDSDLSEGLNPYTFQYEGSRFLYDRLRALIADDPGLGKTIQVLCAINAVTAENTKQLKVLILCPKSMLITWKREIEKWGVKNDYHIHNWERLSSSKWQDTICTDWDIVVGDESHRCIKNPQGKRAKVFQEGIVPRSKRVWLATATPASKDGTDYYVTLKVLLPLLFEKVSYWKFKIQFCQEYVDRFSSSGKAYKGFKNTHILKELFSKCALRRRKETVLPALPPKIITDIEVELDETITAQYLDLDVYEVEQCILEDRPIPGHLAHVMQATAISKIPFLVELVDSLPRNKPLVVFAWHKIVVERVVKALEAEGIIVEFINGDVSTDKRQIIIDKFMTFKIEVLVLNMSSGGTGITLTTANTAIYVEYPHSPTDWKQSMDRIHRIGSVGTSINILKIIATGSFDKQIFDVLDRRIKKMEEVGV